MRKMMFIAVALVCAMSVQADIIANLLVNSGFESDPYDTGWTGILGGGGRVEGGAEGGAVNSGAQAVIFDFQDMGPWAFFGLQQNVAVTAGETYELDGFVNILNTAPIIGKLEWTWRDSGGGDLGSGGTPDYTGDAGTWTYQDMVMSELVAPTGAVSIDVKVVAGSIGTTVGWNAVTFDDISFGQQAIPEPATIGMLGLGCVGVFLMRRRMVQI